MRNDFFKYLFELMGRDKNIYALTGDLGYGGFTKIKDYYKNRFINVGAAEQTMLDIAVGLALEGKKPVCYSITPFLLYRPFETIRTYINYEKIPVILIGSGRGDDYAHEGFSHFAGDDHEFMHHFNNIHSFWPDTKELMRDILKTAVDNGDPYYINLSKK